MSLDATLWAWQQKLRPTHKLLLLSLADRAGPDHTVWPSCAQLEADTGLNPKTIYEAIGQLKSTGLLRDTGSRKGITKQVIVYQLMGVEDRSKHTRKRNTSENGSDPKTESNTPENGCPNTPENGSRNLSVESIRNLPSINNNTSGKKGAYPIEDWKLREPLVLDLEVIFGIPLDFVDQQAVFFRGYWRDKNSSSDCWDTWFAKRCVEEWQKIN